ncbi:hypothetical protein FRB94_004808 [Tulasnella sp. JGI-2019a]|nr:hypothetical protein FRB94_004808 [Tulasnella sp. JGI-2019a]
MQPQSSSRLADVICTEILARLVRHRDRSTTDPDPLFVAIQGPQGSGKTTVVRAVQKSLSSPESGHGLSVAVLSLDDLYLPHTGLVNLANAHPTNLLLRGRGQPGTHDIDLGQAILEALLKINNTRISIDLPSFNKSLFNGEGDRGPTGSWLTVDPPVDIVILEGWCMGFYPLEDSELTKRYEEVISTPSNEDSLPNIRTIMESVSLDDMRTINMYLKDYPLRLYSFFSMFIQIKPGSDNPYSPIYKLRLEQEHHMKSMNGGEGMTDEQVKLFIDRYIPGYLFFAGGIERGSLMLDDAITSVDNPPWKGSLLRVTIDEDRRLSSVEKL